MTIRPVKSTDRDVWLQMRAALWPEQTETELGIEADHFLRGSKSSLLTAVFVHADEQDHLTGFIELFIRNVAEGCDGPAPHVEGWYVRPDSRNRGVGRALMNAAGTWARSRGFNELASDTTADNELSQRVHQKLGFEITERSVHFRKALEASESNQVEASKTGIDRLTDSFFALFCNRDGAPELERIFDLFVPNGLIAKCTGPDPEISTLHEFIAPRQELLTSGTLTEFSESETSERTQIFGNIAQRISTYQKSGCLDGVPFTTRGVKTFQFVKTRLGWRIFSVTWDDERDGLAIEELA
ncbi:MAG TPA: GNAT family N-acetyltransferase [Thermoanaerobaculia bacterium]|jgi:GNAT superfamily N-acetyltransferase|nr:GNAT family N-acetyltransferase [Thermoanaerobaculia bacterium]